jgi:site-specific recombinase XerD
VGLLTPAVLRVTFYRNLLNAGVNPHIVGMWIDNSTLKSMDMYYRTFEQDIEQDVALKALEGLSE